MRVSINTYGIGIGLLGALSLGATGVESFAPPRIALREIGGVQTPFSSLHDKRRSTTSLSFWFDKKGEGKSIKDVVEFSGMQPQVYPQRWVQLTYLSLLALLSDWVCFSVAAAPSTFEASFGHSAASIIDIFLFTNFGLKTAIQSAAVLMMTGCWCRACRFGLSALGKRRVGRL
jgi:hypothetical protein